MVIWIARAFGPQNMYRCQKGEVEPRKREWLAGLLPRVIKEPVSLKQTLTDFAVNSKESAEGMRVFQELNQDAIMFELFDASHQLSNIK